MDRYNLLDPVVAELRKMGCSNWGQLSNQTGIPAGTIYRIAYRRSRNPGVLTIQTLARTLLKRKQ